MMMIFAENDDADYAHATTRGSLRTLASVGLRHRTGGLPHNGFY